jgi:LysM repeat protein
MRSGLERYWKFSVIGCWLVLCSFSVFAQTTSDTKQIKFWEFDRSLIPAKNIYGLSWDSLNVDSPKFDAERVSFGFLLNLVEEDCDYVHPFEGPITSGFGWRWNRMHKGTDIDLDIGDPVVAAFDGVVRIAKYNYGGFGNYVLIRHYNGLETLYAHLSESVVERNQTVRAGQIIGFGGSTGRSTGPHLHFETRFLGQPIDPSKIIDFKNYKLLSDQIYLNHTWFSPSITAALESSDDEVVAKPRPPKPPAAKKVYHKIKSGDTLYGLSKKYGVSVNDICRLNKISRNTTLRIGVTLRVK